MLDMLLFVYGCYHLKKKHYFSTFFFLLIQAVCVNAVLVKIKNIFQEEESIRQNRESDNFRKAFSEPVLPEPMFSEGEIKAKPYRSLPEKPDNLSAHRKPPGPEESVKTPEATKDAGNQTQVLLNSPVA